MAKKQPAKKQPAKKQAAKKQPAKKQPAGKRRAVRKKASSTAGSPASTESQSTAAQLAAMDDDQLTDERSFLARALREIEEEKAKLSGPLPPELRGYQSPGFQAYITRKSLNYVLDEMNARRKANEDTEDE